MVELLYVYAVNYLAETKKKCFFLEIVNTLRHLPKICFRKVEYDMEV